MDVRVAGSSSWRFEHDDLDILQVALFVRDAAKLPVPDAVDVPPPLTGEVPDLPAVAPELQVAAVTAFDGYRAWSAAAGPDRPGNKLFDWQLVRDAVHRAAASLGLPVNEMDGVAHVVPVRGLWSYIAGPGCGVCSAEVGRDPEAGAAFLHALFVSGTF